MALAVKNTPETTTAHLLDRLSVGILIGVVYVLSSLLVVFKLIPGLWWSVFAEGFATWTLLVAGMLVAGSLLSAIGIWLLGSQPAYGLKAGIFSACAVLLLAMLMARGVSGLIEQWTFQGVIPAMVGMVAAGVLSITLAVVGVGWIVRPKTHSFLMTVEDQGWFSVNAYKRSQGQMVRRGTILGMLVLIGCGLYVMDQHNALGTIANWEINIPFTGQVTIKDPKDAAVLANALTTTKLVRVQSKGDSNLEEGKVIARAEFEAAKEKSQPGKAPTAMPVLGRFEYRESIQEKLAKDYVKIDKAGDENSPFNGGEVVEKSKFDSVVRNMKESGGVLPTSAKELVQPETTTEFATLTLLPGVKYTLPLFIAAFGLWVSWRLVNLPVFADFLIATEAELNKVSWTTRKRLMQDTVVVLITVALLAAFILVMDTVWYKALSWRVIGVLQIQKDDKGAKPKEISW